MTDVADQWNRLTTWFGAHAPSTLVAINPPSSDEDAIRVESSTGREWSTELREWFALHNGGDHGPAFAHILPGYRLLSLAEVEQEWSSLTRVFAARTSALGGDQLLADAAGTVSYTFLPAYIPFASNDSDCLVIDTRGGNASGCVIEFIGEDTDQGRQWASITDMLSAVADALETESACENWVPYVNNGSLDWDYPRFT